MSVTAPSTSTDPTPRAAARIAGLGYVAIFALAIFANFAVVERLIDPDDPAATFANLAADQQLVRWAMAAFVVVFALDVVIAWALHRLLRPHGEAVSALAAWFRIVYTVFLGVAVVFLFLVLRLVAGEGGTATLADPERTALANLLLDAFDITWLVGLVTFGAHLATIGWIMIRTRVAPRLLGWGLVVAGAAYVVDTMAVTTYAGYDDHTAIFETMVIVPAVAAELGFTIWLLARAGRDRSAERAMPSRTAGLAA
jgi:hypothetical protein